MRDSSCLLFLHVPKTAGTSFRLGAAKALGVEHCQFDYGRASPDTTDLVGAHVYREPDYLKFREELERTGCRLLGGHFEHRKYGPLFRSDRVLSFCRDPRQQLMSHYSHVVRFNGFHGTLADFLAGQDGSGRQSRTFGHAPVQVFGFIGVTDRYEESLRVLREAYGLEIGSMALNVNPERGASSDYLIPAEVADAYAAAVRKDMGVYRLANELLDLRLAALDAGYTYVHGMIQGANHSAVRGFAFVSGEEAVVVELEINGKPAGSCRATGDRPGLRAIGVPRHGYVGFDFHKRNLLKAGDLAVVKVAESGQVLGRYILKGQREKSKA